MKKNFLAILVLALCMVASAVSLMNSGNGLEKTVGVYGVTIGLDTPAYDADNVVPDKETLIRNLQEAGYEIEQYDTAFYSGISGERIVATKGRNYVDICYGLTEEEAESVLIEYEDMYLLRKYYMLAQNQNYVYCISSKKAFKQSGFTELSNEGVLYLNK